MLTWLLLLTLTLLPTAALAIPGYREGSVSGSVDGVSASNLSFSGFVFFNFEAGPLLWADADSAEWAGGGTYTFKNDIGTFGHALEEGVVEGVTLELGPRYPFPTPDREPHPLAGSYPGTMILDLEGETMTINIDALNGSPSGFVASASGWSIVPDPVAPVPEPGTWLLMGSGLAAVGFVGRVRCRCCRGPVGIPRPCGRCAICRTPGESRDVCFCGKILARP